MTRSEYVRLWAEARAGGEYPLLIDYFTVPDAELDAGRPPGLFAWLGDLLGLARADPQPEIEAEP